MTSTAGSLSFSQANTQGLSGSDEFQQQQFYSPADVNSSQSHMMNMLQQQNNSNSKIPDIVLSGMADGCFDGDLFGSVSDEALKDGLGHLDFESFQMLTDPTMVTDPDTENSFRLDQLS